MRILAIVLLALGLIGCAANSLKPPADMTEGERLYRANCASCHALRNPVNYSDEEWGMYVEKYGDKLNLSVDSREKILHHLQSSN